MWGVSARNFIRAIYNINKISTEALNIRLEAVVWENVTVLFHMGTPYPKRKVNFPIVIKQSKKWRDVLALSYF